MKAAYTIHEVVIEKNRIEPKTVIALRDDLFDELQELGAVREASDDEAMLANLTAPAEVKPADAPKPVAVSKAAAKAQADAEAKAAEAAAAAAKTDVDPDVTEPANDADLLGDN